MSKTKISLKDVASVELFDLRTYKEILGKKDWKEVNIPLNPSYKVLKGYMNGYWIYNSTNRLKNTHWKR